MTSLELAEVLREQIRREHEIISRHSRRRAILEHFATRLRLGVSEKVVRAEIAAQGETIELMESE
jgi:hypothetical protein